MNTLPNIIYISHPQQAPAASVRYVCETRLKEAADCHLLAFGSVPENVYQLTRPNGRNTFYFPLDSHDTQDTD